MAVEVGAGDAADELVDGVFFLRERAGAVAARRDAALDGFKRTPVLMIGEVPELEGVVGGEAGLFEGFGREEPVALDEGAVGSERLEAMREDVVGMKGEKEIGDKAEVVHVAELFGREAAQRDAAG